MFYAISNSEFLTALFGEDAPWVHVTDFPFDPANIPTSEHLRSWSGNYFSRYPMAEGTNQYFTISNFYCDEKQKARRRKALYRHTPVIVLDDVREKLSMAQVGLLPEPSWILETSPGSEQWGYILTEPCSERGRVENLLDGLVANGLAPDGKDPGMKGVTRYVRLPEGYNTKQAKMVDGKPFKCQILRWAPSHKVTLEQLAAPFFVNLNAERREQRVDGASDIPDHPLLQVDDVITVKEVRSDGRFDVTCPWVNDHTGGEDSGSAVFTNEDGSVGFKCHHGACQTRTGRDLLQLIEGVSPGFGSKFADWKANRAFLAILGGVPSEPVSFLSPAEVPAIETESPAVSFFASEPVSTEPQAAPQKVEGVEEVPQQEGMDQLMSTLRRMHPSSSEAKDVAASAMKIAEEMPAMDKLSLHDDIRDIMGWSKTDHANILKELKTQWYSKSVKDSDVFTSVVFVKEMNQFYDKHTGIFMAPDAFQNAYCHEDGDARQTALKSGVTQKVDKLDYAPKDPAIFEQDGIVFGNTWKEDEQAYGTPGDPSPWLAHWDSLGWTENRKHMLQWMAFTLRHPEIKINHMMILGSREGCGKDFLLYPLMKAMGRNGTTIDGLELKEKFNDYLLGTKYLHINESELDDHHEATAISNRLKPLAAAPPETLRVNPKGVKAIQIRNIVNSTMTTNSKTPVKLNGPSRRFYAVWSDLNTRGSDGQMLGEWQNYWQDMWSWMKGVGSEHCIDYLMNQVDLSDFNPGAPPQVTEFLQDIQQSSKSPVEQTIEKCIENRVGSFRCDILSAADITSFLKMGELLAPELMMFDTRSYKLHPVTVGKTLSKMDRIISVNCRGDNGKTTVWVLRDHVKYSLMGPQEIHAAYIQQTNAVKAQTQLKVV